MNFLPEELETYIQNHTKPEPEVLKKLNRETHAHVLMPQMLSGHLQGRFLNMLTTMIQPQQVLEIGTFTGYSALCIAEGLPERGTIHTIDINEELLAGAEIRERIGCRKESKNIHRQCSRNYTENKSCFRHGFY